MNISASRSAFILSAEAAWANTIFKSLIEIMVAFTAQVSCREYEIGPVTILWAWLTTAMMLLHWYKCMVKTIHVLLNGSYWRRKSCKVEETSSQPPSRAICTAQLLLNYSNPCGKRKSCEGKASPHWFLFTNVSTDLFIWVSSPNRWRHTLSDCHILLKTLLFI